MKHKRSVQIFDDWYQAFGEFLKGIPSGIREFGDILLQNSFSRIQEIRKELPGILPKLDESMMIIVILWLK